MAQITITPAPILWISDTNGNIGTVNVDTGAVTPIGRSSTIFSDIAFSPAEQLFGESFTTLYSVSQTTGASTKIGNFGVSAPLNGLVFSPSGTLYASGSTGLYTINTSTGKATLVGNSGINGGFTSAGDLAFVRGNLYESVTNGAVSDLAQIDPSTGKGTLIGSIVNNPGVWALANANGTLYGVDARSIYSIDTATGKGTLLQTYNSPRLTNARGGASQAEAIICFLRGTLIGTPTGEMPVERLAAGDAVLTLSGEARRLVWVGEGYVRATRGQRTSATPVIVRKGALDDNVPHQDLRVTKAHALYIDEVLIPVEFLVNHRSIVWDDHAQDVALYHLELETHDVVVANGAPAESYRDDGNRWLFQNAGTRSQGAGQEPCAPVLTGGPVVDRVWRRLLDRTGSRPGLPLTNDPDLHLVVDGARVDAAARREDGGVHTFRLPKKPVTVRVVSRAGAPAELGLSRDPRVLGVGVRKIAISEGARLAVIEADDDTLTAGFYDFEPIEGLRWTDGDARLPGELFAELAGPVDVDLYITGRTRYPLLAGTPVAPST